MSHNETLRRRLLEATETFGNHYGSSRNNSLRIAIYDESESHLADFLQTKSATIVSSGMWAGQLLMKEIETIVSRDSKASKIQYHYAPGVHPALWGRGFYKTDGDWQEWAYQTIEKIQLSPGVSHIICSDAVGSPMVKAFDFTVFNALENTSNVWLIIDESHSLGVLGPEGKGISFQLGKEIRPKTIFVSSLNKALGIPAGVIWGTAEAIDTIRKSPWYAGASPPAPAYAYAFKMLLKENSYAKEFALLMDNIACFNQKMAGNALFHAIPDYPVFCSDNASLFDHLLKNGIMASCFPYPSPADAPITRIAITSLHQKEDLDRLAEVCKQFIA
jgi:8-amino-7-oxononanoate synthase